MKFTPLYLGVLLLSAAACKQDREIKVQRVAKESTPATTQAPAADPHAGMPGMTPGAAMPGGSGADPHAGLTAEQLAAAGTAAVASPQFTDTPPAHWKKQALSPMRLASYRVEGEGGATADISFTILRRAPGGTLANVNRWRDQLAQPPLDEAALKQSALTIKSSFGEALAVDIEGLAPGGTPAKDGRMIGAIADNADNAWFFKMRGNAALVAAEKDNFVKWVQTVKPSAESPAPTATTTPPTPAASPPPTAPAAPAAPAAGDGNLTWQAPAGWVLAPAASAMRYATFTMAGADGAKGELAITHFPGSVGSDLDNVNRWRQQVGLPAVDQAGLTPLVTKLSAGTKTIQLIDVTGTETRLSAGWTGHGTETWFFKFTGPDALVGAEKAKFTAFLESVRFTQPEK
ncbi:MAG: hypothetical protein WCO57_14865 [Verrucomicrobiota bacterium]